MRKTIFLKDCWQFRKADSRKWTQVRVPHDFAARENFDRNSDTSFSIHFGLISVQNVMFSVIYVLYKPPLYIY